MKTKTKIRRSRKKKKVSILYFTLSHLSCPQSISLTQHFFTIPLRTDEDYDYYEGEDEEEHEEEEEGKNDNGMEILMYNRFIRSTHSDFNLLQPSTRWL